MIILFFLCIVVLFFSIYTKSNNKEVVYKNNTDVNLTVSIDKYDLDVSFYGGNLIKSTLKYGNKYEKIIKVTNPYDEVVTVALSIKDVKISSDKVLYKIYYSNNYDSDYKELLNDSIIKDMNLGYNLGIEKKSTVYFKLEITSNIEKKDVDFEGKLDIVTNLTKKELFIKNVNEIVEDLEKKIDNLKGISDSGYYYYQVTDLLKGYIIIDAADISDLKYILTLYNDDLMVKNLNYKYLKKSKIENVDKDFISTINNDVVCKLFTKKSCLDFKTIKENVSGGKEFFYESAYKVINEVKKIKFENKNVIIDVTSDISNQTNIKGFIVLTKNKEYILYITNDKYMVSGYNLTKNGDFEKNSITIRAYNETAYNLAAKDYNVVCSFSKLNDCYKKGGERIG